MNSENQNMLGLSRNRLLESSPTVSFIAEYKEIIDIERLKNAFAMLCVKEPLINKKAVILNNGDCILEDCKENTVSVITGEFDTLLFYDDIRGIYINPLNGLFKFMTVNGKFVIALCHICVGDVKSLAILIEELFGFYEKKSKNAEPKNVFLFSDKNDIPANINTFIIEKITGELELDWYKKKKHFKESNYQKYFSACEKERERVTKTFILSKRKTEEFKECCKLRETDFSTELCGLFFYSLSDKKRNKKYNSLNFGSDIRYFDDKPYELGVGPFGVYAAVMKPKKKYVSKKGKEKAFHDEIYKKVTSAFCSYYDDLFLMNVHPRLCDASYFYSKGLCKIKCVEKFSKNYGCDNKKKLKFDFYNFDLKPWEALHGFDYINCTGNFSGKDDFYVSAVVRNRETVITVTADKKLYGENINEICENVIKKIDMAINT